MSLSVIFSAGFECDPDICQGCSSVALGGQPPEGKEECHNMRLRMRMHKRVAVGLSSIAGWGAFIMVRVMLVPGADAELYGTGSFLVVSDNLHLRIAGGSQEERADWGVHRGGRRSAGGRP